MHKTNEPDSAKSGEDGNKGFDNEEGFHSAADAAVEVEYATNYQKNQGKRQNMIMSGSE